MFKTSLLLLNFCLYAYINAIKYANILQILSHVDDKKMRMLQHFLQLSYIDLILYQEQFLT